MTQTKRFLISTGDHSADIHGENLVRAILSKNSQVHFSALGGCRLKSVCQNFLYNLVQMDVGGFTKPLKQFFTLKNILCKKIFPLLDSGKIDAVILIDYYGFNIHVARRAFKKNIPVYYFVSPQVWASRKGRVLELKKVVSKMLVIFPFEKKLYQDYGVPVEFVGNPLIDEIVKVSTKVPTSQDKIKIGLMPGSRLREIFYHLPLLLETVKILWQQNPQIEFVLYQADSLEESLYQKYLDQFLNVEQKQKITVLRNADWKDRLDLSLSLTASGTVTLENALLGVPMIVFYRTSWLTYSIAKKIIQVPYISMPNILSGKEIVPELIQDKANAKNLALQTQKFLNNKKLLQQMKSDMQQLRQNLGEAGSYDRAAEIILA